MSFLMRHESMSFSRAKRSVDKFSIRKNQETTKKLDPSKLSNNGISLRYTQPAQLLYQCDGLLGRVPKEDRTIKHYRCRRRRR